MHRFLIGTRRAPAKPTKAMMTLVCSPSRRFSTTTSNTDIRPLSWGPASVTYGSSSILDILLLTKLLPQVGEIKSLAGVDFLTISPALLEELKNSTVPVPKKLDAHASEKAEPIPKVSFINNEPEFRWALLQEQMAFDKLHEGIKKFAEDGETLKSLLRKKLST